MKYSERLGKISDEQLQKALDRFNLGRFVEAEPITQGLFGQNLFLTSSRGEFVLRGVPHYSWQFKNERFFAKLLKERTSAPVPWPYLLDEETDVFGWSYAIMPRLKGIQLSDSNLGSFKQDELRLIAEAQGKMLAEMQKLTWNHPGRYDAKTDAIKPLKESFFAWFKKNIFQRLEKAKNYNNKTTDNDLAWVKNQFEKTRASLSEDFRPCFVMQDYKPGNMIVDRTDGDWQVAGLFDLMESYFGNGEADISRMFCVYIDLKRKDLARAFIEAYQGEKGKVEGFSNRFPIFIIHDRAIIWEWVQRTGKVWWDKSLTFEQWVRPFIRL